MAFSVNHRCFAPAKRRSRPCASRNESPRGAQLKIPLLDRHSSNYCRLHKIWPKSDSLGRHESARNAAGRQQAHRVPATYRVCRCATTGIRVRMCVWHNGEHRVCVVRVRGFAVGVGAWVLVENSIVDSNQKKGLHLTRNSLRLFFVG